ncbi:hypothetical protein KIN20_036514 [Parelaphostrongylus tenuis]|uniref:Uncharacterized protein n=1 Tax=Parelaphostrongylus tenuis TaxID=148309 RepID=A0AAD5RCQ1_PARTN|nr:hypothetical protein KIN20_036514 [Parelaphostrongylus tenuis]
MDLLGYIADVSARVAFFKAVLSSLGTIQKIHKGRPIDPENPLIVSKDYRSRKETEERNKEGRKKGKEKRKKGIKKEEMKKDKRERKERKERKEERERKERGKIGSGSLATCMFVIYGTESTQVKHGYNESSTRSAWICAVYVMTGHVRYHEHKESCVFVVNEVINMRFKD